MKRLLGLLLLLAAPVYAQTFGPVQSVDDANKPPLGDACISANINQVYLVRETAQQIGCLNDTWQDLGDEYHVRMYGAACDGATTDSATGVQAAVDAAELVRGTVVLPSDAQCRLDSTLLIDAAGVKIRGYGDSGTDSGLLINHAGVGVQIDNKNTVLEGFTIDCSGTGVTGLLITNGSQSVIRETLVDNCTGHALLMDTDQSIAQKTITACSNPSTPYACCDADDLGTCGQNNFVTFVDSQFSTSNIGIEIEDAETLDSNGTVFERVAVRSNTAMGAILRGQGGRIRQGNYQFTTLGYGIQWGTELDQYQKTHGWIVEAPWVEGNGFSDASCTGPQAPVNCCTEGPPTPAGTCDETTGPIDFGILANSAVTFRSGSVNTQIAQKDSNAQCDGSGDPIDCCTGLNAGTCDGTVEIKRPGESVGEKWVDGDQANYWLKNFADSGSTDESVALQLSPARSVGLAGNLGRYGAELRADRVGAYNATGSSTANFCIGVSTADVLDDKMCLNADDTVMFPAMAPGGTECLQMLSTGEVQTTGSGCGGSETNTLTDATGNIADDQVPIGTSGGGAVAYADLPDNCNDQAKTLNYDSTTNSFTCLDDAGSTGGSLDNLPLRSDGAPGDNITIINGDSLTIAGGEGIDTSNSGATPNYTHTVTCESATITNIGCASFPDAQFSVAGGAVTIDDAALEADDVDLTDMTDAIAASPCGGGSSDFHCLGGVDDDLPKDNTLTASMFEASNAVGDGQVAAWDNILQQFTWSDLGQASAGVGSIGDCSPSGGACLDGSVGSGNLITWYDADGNGTMSFDNTADEFAFNKPVGSSPPATGLGYGGRLRLAEAAGQGGQVMYFQAPEAMAFDRTCQLTDNAGMIPTDCLDTAVLNTTTGFAAPTGNVTLSAVEGVAVTALRSDADIPIDVSIAPTWTGVHTFGAGSQIVATATTTHDVDFTTGLLALPQTTTGSNDCTKAGEVWYVTDVASGLRHRVCEGAGVDPVLQGDGGGGANLLTDNDWTANKGEIAVSTANDNEAALLSVGADNTFIVADSGEATGLKYVTATGAGSARDIMGLDVVNTGDLDDTECTDGQIWNKVSGSWACADNENLLLVANVEPATALAAGDPVYIVGHNGTNPTVAYADADAAGEMPAFIVAEAIADAGTGNVLLAGALGGLNTNSWSVGDALYPSTTPGTLTSTRPTGATALVQRVATVTRSHATLGEIMVVGAGRSNDESNSIDPDRIAGDDTDDDLLDVDAGGTGADLSVTGGANQVVKQLSSGADFTVAQLNFTELAGQASDTQIADGAVDGGSGGEIADNTVDANDIAPNGVDSSELGATFSECFTLYDVDGIAAGSIQSVFRAPTGGALTITAISCEANVAADITVNFNKDTLCDTALASTTNVETGDLICGTTMTAGSVETGAGEDNFAASDCADLEVVSVTNAVRMNLCVEYTYD